VQAVLESLGKPRGPEDTRTQAQRFHDALQEGCELLLRTRMVPDRAGADTQVIAHIGLSQLRGMPGASQLEAAWLAGEPGYLTGKDAEAAACDAMIVPVVTGHPDWQVIDQILRVCLAAAPHLKDLSPKAHEALRMQVARLAIDFVSGPAGIAGFLRTHLLGAPYNSASLPLDIGYSASVPASIRRAVLLRDKRCAWPRCGRPAAVRDVHHIVHKKDGGKTRVSSCVLLCQFHHDVCIHRWGWQIILHPDGTTEARGPDGQILRSHDPPTARAGLGPVAGRLPGRLVADGVQERGMPTKGWLIMRARICASHCRPGSPPVRRR
jgi:5-methylcytosine-specific restriction endonuclease McrA